MRLARLILTAGAWTGKLWGRSRPWLSPSDRSSVGSGRMASRFSATTFRSSSWIARRTATFMAFRRQAEEGFKIGKFHHRHQSGGCRQHRPPHWTGRRRRARRNRALPRKADGRRGWLQDLHVREFARRALHRRCAAGTPQRRRARRVSPVTATSSAPPSARSWLTFPCTGRRRTTRPCSGCRDPR